MPSWLRAIAGPAVSQAAASANALARRVAFMVVGGVAFVVALCFVIAALYTWLQGAYGTIAAQLTVACLFLLVGVIAIIVARSTGRPQQTTTSYRFERSDTEPAGFPTVASAFAMGFARGLRRR